MTNMQEQMLVNLMYYLSNKGSATAKSPLLPVSKFPNIEIEHLQKTPEKSLASLVSYPNPQRSGFETR